MLKITGNDIQLTRGDTAYIDLNILDQTGSPYVLDEGDEVHAQIRKKANDGELILDGNITVSEGVPVWTLTHDETKDIPIGTYVYDVELVTSSGEVFTFIEKSKFKITDEVTYDE